MLEADFDNVRFIQKTSPTTVATLSNGEKTPVMRDLAFEELAQRLGGGWIMIAADDDRAMIRTASLKGVRVMTPSALSEKALTAMRAQAGKSHFDADELYAQYYFKDGSAALVSAIPTREDFESLKAAGVPFGISGFTSAGTMSLLNDRYGVFRPGARFTGDVIVIEAKKSGLN